MQIVGRCLGAAVTNILDLSLRDVEGAVPYGFERLQIRCRRRFVNDFVVVGDGALCQEQDCKQLCKRIVYTFYVQFLRIWKPNGA